MIVISDTSPINYLVLIGEIELLPQLFGQVILPHAVLTELSHTRTPALVRSWIAAPPAWLEVRTPATVDPNLGPDLGEREAISLALEMKADLLLVDDKKARRLARARGLRLTGTLGVLELAATKGLVDLEDAFARLRKTDFQISEDLLQEILSRRKP